MPRLDLSKKQREYAVYALKQMQQRDYKDIKFNLEMAKIEDGVRDLTFGRMVFSIPDDHRRILALIYPEIDSQDAEIRTKAWKKLFKNPLTKPYRLNAKEQGKHAKAQPIYFNT